MNRHDLDLIEIGQKEERKAIVDWLRKGGYQQITHLVEQGAHRK